MAERKVRWLEEPEEKDYAAAQSYLSLLVPGGARALIERLRVAPPAAGARRTSCARRGCRCSAPKQSEEVAEKLAKVRAKEPLSPILLVVLRPDVAAQIADGYHRTCAAYLTHEDTLVPGRILFA